MAVCVLAAAAAAAAAAIVHSVLVIVWDCFLVFPVGLFLFGWVLPKNRMRMKTPLARAFVLYLLSCILENNTSVQHATEKWALRNINETIFSIVLTACRLTNTEKPVVLFFFDRARRIFIEHSICETIGKWKCERWGPTTHSTTVLLCVQASAYSLQRFLVALIFGS